MPSAKKARNIFEASTLAANDEPISFKNDIDQNINSAESWGMYKPTSSKIFKGNGYCSFHLYLVNIDTGVEAELYFNNVKKGKGSNYSVKRNSHFAKLYADCFGKTSPAKYSRAQQLLKHFHNEDCLLLCRVERKKRAKSGVYYFNVVEQKNGNQLETDWKPIGNQLENNWKWQTSETPINTWAGGQSQVIINNQIENGIMEEYGRIKIINHNKKAGESKDQYEQRVINETITAFLK